MTEQVYIKIANDILKNGSSWQKKCIKYFMRNRNGRVLPGEMKHYIDNLIKQGTVEV